MHSPNKNLQVQTDNLHRNHLLKSMLFIFLQYITPQHLLSRVAGWFASSTIIPLKNTLISRFVRAFDVNMEEAIEENPLNYASFNDFFTRELKPDARPIAQEDNGITSPADGAFSQLGAIENGRVFQAKGQDFTTEELLGGTIEDAALFKQGEFATIYLSPKDYHRLHMPIDGKLVSMRHVPGDLFSVNPTTAENVPRLFARNERVVCIFETAAGPMAMVLVGAMIVASIETVWAGQLAPVGKQILSVDYSADISLKKGEEMGRFKLGSTVVLLFPENTIQWQEELRAGTPVQMGQTIAEIH